jgi:kynurenine formamidase
MHIYEGGKPLSDFPLERFYGEAVVLDVPKDELEEITAADLENATPDVRAGEIVLIHTGWGRFYFGEERKHELYLAKRQPGLVVDAAQWLVDKGVQAVGIDTFAVRHPFPVNSDYPLTEEGILAGKSRPKEPVHDILLGNEVLIIEQLTNLHLIVGKRVTVMFLPLPFVGLDGSPVRAVALVD